MKKTQATHSKYEDRILRKNKGSIRREDIETIEYTVDYKYQADFVLTTESGKSIYIEAKGNPRWFDTAYRKKWLAMYQQVKERYDIRFMIYEPGIVPSGCKKMTIEDWCDRNSIQYCFGDKVPETWRNE